ncbi:MAG: hypothetical protein ABI995_08565 [Acidobacteriota bacterium]
MQRAHRWVGTITLVIFLLTGAYMRWIHAPPLGQLPDATRAVFRSRHLYIMLGALANLALARSLPLKAVDRVISILVLAAPVFLLAGFAIEPENGFHPDAHWAALGLYALFAAAALLVIRPRFPSS